MIQAVDITLGCDPEFFLRDKSTGLPVSAHDVVPGTKEKPFKMACGSNLMADGTAVEFSTPPASTAEAFAANIGNALQEINDGLDQNRFDLAFEPCVKFPSKYFKGLPYEATALGCFPDFNAYTGQPNQPYENRLGTKRTASGHIHIGFLNGALEEDVYGSEHIRRCSELVQILDGLFVPFRLTYDDDTERARTYGAIGNFRPKPYGVEYRTLSNAWLRHPHLWYKMFNKAQWAVNMYTAGLRAPSLFNRRTLHRLNTKGIPALYPKA